MNSDAIFSSETHYAMRRAYCKWGSTDHFSQFNDYFSTWVDIFLHGRSLSLFNYAHAAINFTLNC